VKQEREREKKGGGCDERFLRAGSKKRGGEGKVAYQSRKKRKAVEALFLYNTNEPGFEGQKRLSDGKKREKT